MRIRYREDTDFRWFFYAQSCHFEERGSSDSEQAKQITSVYRQRLVKYLAELLVWSSLRHDDKIVYKSLWATIVRKKNAKKILRFIAV